MSYTIDGLTPAEWVRRRSRELHERDILTITIPQHIRLTIVTDTYIDGCMAVQLHEAEGQPYSILSCHVPESELIPKDAFYLKEWAENSEVAQAIFDADLVIPIDAPVYDSGFVKAYAYKLAR